MCLSLHRLGIGRGVFDWFTNIGPIWIQDLSGYVCYGIQFVGSRNPNDDKASIGS